MNKIYTNKQLLDRVVSLPSFNKEIGIPKNLIIGIRSAEDKADEFDDKMYVFIDGNFKLVTSCTTNAGKSVLLGGWKLYNPKGVAVVKSDEIYYDAYKKSNGTTIPHHRYKMPCLSQVKEMKYFRDGDNDEKTEEQGLVYVGNYATNIHFSNYNLFTKIKTTIIGGWSAGCQVLNDPDKYRELLALFNDEPITYCLLKEF